MTKASKDNSTLPKKVRLRRRMLRALGDVEPVIMETHGGKGRIFLECYSHVTRGIVIERETDKIEHLATQRPTWSVVQGDSLRILAYGIGDHLPVNFLDVDPWGDPWPTLKGFFWSDRPKPDRLVVVVQDGLRQKVQQGGGWDVASLEPMVKKYGSEFGAIYLDVSQDFLQTIADQGGYEMETWHGYHCGHQDLQTHSAAIFRRKP
jgi:hypothetical protein